MNKKKKCKACRSSSYKVEVEVVEVEVVLSLVLTDNFLHLTKTTMINPVMVSMVKNIIIQEYPKGVCNPFKNQRRGLCFTQTTGYAFSG